MPDVYETDGIPVGIWDFQKRSDGLAHGEEGHNGFRCGICARESPGMLAITDHGIDYWQDKQLEWQEECDMVMSQFDSDVADHFPVHRPGDPTCDCPLKPTLPMKPNPPFERALGKTAPNGVLEEGP